MRSVVAVVCIGAILVAALVGVVALYATLPQLCDLTEGFPAPPRRVVHDPAVAPALQALVVSHHLARASLPAARS